MLGKIFVVLLFKRQAYVRRGYCHIIRLCSSLIPAEEFYLLLSIVEQITTWDKISHNCMVRTSQILTLTSYLLQVPYNLGSIVRNELPGTAQDQAELPLELSSVMETSLGFTEIPFRSKTNTSLFSPHSL